jgi:hypothetical protein
MGIERPYTSDDTRAIWEFMKAGGNIIIADDFGHGNSLWDNTYQGMGTDDGVIKDIRFKHQRLYDPSYIKNTKFVSINATFLGRNYQLILNEPAALEIKPGYYSRSSILAKSGPGSWLDKNDNGVRDPIETKDSYDIIAYHKNNKYNSAAVIISDPGLFINDNWEMMDNSNFILHLINYLLPDGGEVIFDESRHINENTFENSRHVLYSGLVYFTSSVWSIFILALLIIIGTLIVGGKIRPQVHWTNRSLLYLKYLNILNQPEINTNDYWEIYSTFLEKVRLSYGFSSEEFRNLDRDTLYKLVHDKHLWNFISQQFPLYPDNEYYKYITRRILKWSPVHPDELEAEHDEVEAGVKDMEDDQNYTEDFQQDDDSGEVYTEMTPIEDTLEYDEILRQRSKPVYSKEYRNLYGEEDEYNHEYRRY